MAQRLADGSIKLNDGRIIYANSVILGQDLCEIVPLCVPPPAWPFVSGGGGGSSSGAGTPGARGADGARGLQGFQGNDGAFGGPQGNQGNQGIAGVGTQGFQGNQGLVGAGVQGSQGPAGVQGNQGVVGFQGLQGFQGSGVQGNQGNQGLQGFQGEPGGTGAFFARLDTALEGTSPTLTLLPYKGNVVEVNGENVIIPPGGFTRSVADNLITAAGTDSGAPGSPNTLYFVYVSNSMSPFSPLSIRLSSTSYTVVDGVRYLGAAGNAHNWRFVGLVYLNATPEFESSPQNRLISNYYNRLRTNLYAPASGDFSTSSNVFVQVDPAGSLTYSFISNGEDSIGTAAAACASESDISVIGVGIGIDSLTTPDPIDLNGRGGVGIQTTVDPEKELNLPEGFHFGTLLFAVSVGAIALSAIDPNFGSGAAATYMDGSILV